MALFRIGLGLTLLVDLAGRWPDLVAHYTDDGVLPRSIAPVYTISVHGLDGSATYAGLLFLLAAAFAVALVVGYRTQLATFFSSSTTKMRIASIIGNVSDQVCSRATGCYQVCLALLVFRSRFIGQGPPHKIGLRQERCINQQRSVS